MLPSYWLGDFAAPSDASSDSEAAGAASDAVEDVPAELVALDNQNRCVRLTNLTKTFDSKTGKKVRGGSFWCALLS